MRKTIIALAAVGSLAAGCTTAEEGGVGGAAVGALAGQAIGGNTKSTLIGAGIGAVSGYLIGRAIDNRPGYCQNYDRRTGRAVGRPYQC